MARLSEVCDMYDVPTTGTTLSLPKVCPEIEVVIPNGAVTKKLSVGLEIFESVQKGDHVTFCPGIILSIVPLRRKFHESISITLPIPETSDSEFCTLRMYCCIEAKLKEDSVWKDITEEMSLTQKNGIATFQSTVSASFWLIKVKPEQKEEEEEMRSVFKKMLIAKESEKERKKNELQYLTAAKEGDLDGVVDCIESKNVPINHTNLKGIGALAVAIKFDHIDIFRALLKMNANVHIKSKKNNTLLHFATLSQKYEIAVELIRHGVDVNVQSTDGFTAFYMASMNNDIKIAQLLLDNGANIHLTTTDGFSPLDIAIQQGSHDVVNLLLLEIPRSPREGQNLEELRI